MIHDGRRHHCSFSFNYPPHMRGAVTQILQDQEAIGWGNAIKGLLSKSWIDLASKEYEYGKQSLPAGEQRMKRCLASLLEYSTGIWKSRNSALHDSKDLENQRLRSLMADNISHLHSQADLLCFEDRYLCEIPLDRLLRSSPSTQRRWLKRMHDSKALHTKMGERQTLITSYFRRQDSTR